MKDEIFLVSNIHRSGSSMMMRCLEAGGMDVAFDDSQEDLHDAYMTEGYDPNPHGFYALDEDFSRPDFPTLYAGRAMKCPIRDLSVLPAGKYKLLFLRRDPDEIFASMRAFSPFISWGMDAVITFFYDTIVGAFLARAHARGDMEIVELQYADVVKNPTKAFEALAAAGWPIDVAKAAAVVDPTLHRLRLEQK